MRGPGCAAAVLFVLIGDASPASADDAVMERQNNLTASVVDYGASATYARAIANWISVGVSGTYLPSGIENYSLVGGGLHLRYHRRRTRNPRFFAEVSVRAFRLFDIELSDSFVVGFGGSSDLNTTALVAGAWVGWRWFWDSGLNVGIGAGLDYPFASWGECTSRCVLADERIDVRPLLDFGYAF